jgi:ABC-type polysaccharide/polyol phosphate export permease
MVQTVAGVWRRRSVVRYFVGLFLTTSYRTKSLGFLWALLDPLMFMCVYYLVFAMILAHRPLVFMLHIYIGVVSFRFLNTSIAQSAQILRGQAGLIREIAFPKAALPVAVVATRLFDFGVAWMAACVIGIAFNVYPTPAWLMILPLAFIQAGFVLGLSFLTAYLGVFFADIQNILDFALRLWFYLSPVLYTLTDISRKFAGKPLLEDLFLLNPMTSVLQLYEAPVFLGRAPDPYFIGRAALAACISLAVGLYVFSRAEGQLSKYV